MDSIIRASLLVFKLRNEASNSVAREELIELVRSEGMTGWLNRVEGISIVVREEVELKNRTERDKLTVALEEAKESRGQTEIVEAQLKLASHSTRTLTLDEALTAWGEVEFKSVTSGKKIDSWLERARLGLSHENYALVKDSLDEAGELLVTAGDWDRRNRLKVYEGLYGIVARDFVKASTELLSAVATFTAEELFSYPRLICYTLLTSVVALERVDLKSKVIDSHEIIAALDAARKDSPAQDFVSAAGDLVAALYECRYRDFMLGLVHVCSTVFASDVYLHRHARWFLREMRCNAYAQFLASYRGVTLVSMANAFGVSVRFLDEELARFIAMKRIAAKIDKVAGVVETTQPDPVNAKYQRVLKEGDGLLNKIQKLARAVNV